MSTDKHALTGYLLVLFVAISVFVLLQEKNSGVKTISATEAAKLIERDTTVVLLDVRTAEEWRSSTGHLTNALLFPLQDLNTRLTELEPMRNTLMIVYCRSGGRSGKAVKLLIEKGFNAMSLEGGIRRWNAEQFPVVQEKLQ